MMSIGFLAELITAYQGRDEDSYSIAEQTPAPEKMKSVGGSSHAEIRIPHADFRIPNDANS